MSKTLAGNGIDPEVVFPEVEKMIYSQAWKCAQTYPVTFEEARSVAYWAFMQACRDFKPGRKMKFSSWCYYWVWCDLKTWVTKRTKDPLCFTEIDDDLCGAVAPMLGDYLDLVGDLGEDAKEIVRLIIETPAELVGQAMTPKQYLKKVKDLLVEEGRDKQALDKACLALQEKFQEAWA